MAGQHPTNANFGPEFRAKIRAAMLMGLPVVDADKPTFHFADGRTFTVADDNNSPYDWTTTPTGLPPKDDIQVTCAMETKGGTGARGEPRTRIGEFDEDLATLYFFEDEWAEVFDFTSVDLGETTYDRLKRTPPLALYDVQLEVVTVRARDEG